MNYITSCLLSNEESGFLLFAVKSGNQVFEITCQFGLNMGMGQCSCQSASSSSRAKMDYPLTFLVLLATEALNSLKNQY